MMAQQGFGGVAALLHYYVCLCVSACVQSHICIRSQVCSVHTCTDVPFGRAEVFNFCSLCLSLRKQTNLQSCQDGHHLFTWLSKI